jgi:hypothetical protein
MHIDHDTSVCILGPLVCNRSNISLWNRTYVKFPVSLPSLLYLTNVFGCTVILHRFFVIQSINQSVGLLW